MSSSASRLTNHNTKHRKQFVKGPRDICQAPGFYVAKVVRLQVFRSLFETRVMVGLRVKESVWSISSPDTLDLGNKHGLFVLGRLSV